MEWTLVILCAFSLLFLMAGATAWGGNAPPPNQRESYSIMPGTPYDPRNE